MIYVPISHLEATAHRFVVQSNWSERTANWAMCLCGALCVIISSTHDQFADLWATNECQRWDREDTQIIMSIRRRRPR